MADIKTKQNDASVAEFLDGVANETRRQDSYVVLEMMRKITGLEPKMWGDAIIGFGSQHYQYASGREGDMPLIGFSPRKQNLTLYVMGSFTPHTELLEKLGKHKTGVGCLYINKLKDVDVKVLKELIKQSVKAAAE